MYRKSHILLVTVILLMAVKPGAGQTVFEGFEETTLDDADWVLVTSDVILRNQPCQAVTNYGSVFNPCNRQNFFKIDVDRSFCIG